MRRTIVFCFIILLSILSISTNAIDINEYIEDKKNVSVRQLIKKADEFMSIKNEPDSALLYYSIVSNRYMDDMSFDDKRDCIDALIGRWFVYFFYYFDYNKSYENILKASEIANKINCRVSKTQMYFGCMFQAMAEQTKDAQLYKKAYRHTYSAIENSIKEKNEEVLNVTFTNLISLANDMDSLKDIEDIWHMYNAYDFKKYDLLIDYNKYFYKALVCNKAGRYDEALKFYDRQIALINNSYEYHRFLLISYLKKSETYLKQNNTEGALSTLKIMSDISRKHDIKDARLNIYELYNDLYKKRGDYKKADLYRDSLFMMKDSLLNYRQITSINETDFLNEIKSIDDKLQELKLQNSFQKKMFWAGLVVLCLIITFTILLLRKNKELTKTNKELYNKNVMLLKSEDKEKEINRKLKNSDIDPGSISDIDAELDAEEKELLDRILKVMDDTEMICSFNFTIEKLSFMTESKQRLVSELIKKVYNCNFNSFISDYRIKEACRRFNNIEDYGNLTIEGVGNSVGFKSRSNFVSTFKKFTGLNPSQYKKMAEMNA